MNKNLPPLLLVAALLPMSSFVQAEGTGVYVTPKLGYGQMKASFKVVEDGEPDFKVGSQSKSAAVFGLAAGYDFSKKLSVPLRVELEYTGMGDNTKKRRHSGTFEEEDKTTVGASALFVNTYFDFHNRSAFTPYVGLGLGNSFLSAKGRHVELQGNWDDKYGEKTTTNFAWNVGVGGAWKVSENFALDLGYRYANLGKAKSKKAYDLTSNYQQDYWLEAKDVEIHQFLLGARFSF